MIFLEGPAGGVPPMSDTPELVDSAINFLSEGSGSLAIDTERAGSFLSNDRACLIQVRRQGAGTVLLDPLAAPDAVRAAADFFNEVGWILHSAQDDLPCLLDLGFYPPVLDDTLLAGAIIGLDRIGLNPMMEDLLGMSVEKGKGQEDWSRRPLDQGMLNYAALDVEKLVELRDEVVAQVTALGRLEWYRQECDFVVSQAQPIRPMAFSSVKGISTLRSDRQLAMAYYLHRARLEIAEEYDTPITTVLPHAAVVDVAKSRAPQKALKDELRRNRWRGGVQDPSPLFDALALTSTAPPSTWKSLDLRGMVQARKARSPQSPSPAYWQDIDPSSYRRYEQWRSVLSGVAEDLGLRLDTIITIRLLKAMAWQLYGPEAALSADVDDRIMQADDFLAAWDVRPWQMEIILTVLEDFF